MRLVAIPRDAASRLFGMRERLARDLRRRQKDCADVAGGRGLRLLRDTVAEGAQGDAGCAEGGWRLSRDAERAAGRARRAGRASAEGLLKPDEIKFDSLSS